MKRTAWRLLAAMIMLSFVMVAPAAARPAATSCDEVLTDRVIHGNLIVPTSGHCELNNVTVLGDVQLGQFAGFTPYDSLVKGTITGSRFELLHVLNTHVEGGIRMRGGVTVELDRATVAGGVRLSDTLSVRLLDTATSGPLTVRGPEGDVRICGTTVGGDARIVGVDGRVLVGGELATCAANEVRGTLRVHHNQGEIVVANNLVGHNLVCAANEPAPVVYDNQVGGKARGQCGAGEPVSPQELGDEG